MPNSHEKNEVMGNFGCEWVIVTIELLSVTVQKIKTVLEKHSSVLHILHGCTGFSLVNEVRELVI